MELLQFTDAGIYCPMADVYLDPQRSVRRALITHAHSDHARSGSKAYLAHHDSAVPLKVRLGKSIPLQTIGYGEPIQINGVRFSFHPAGHILGSAQIRVEYQGEVWVYSGDYKLEDDGFSEAFEAVPCHTFLTESTFGLPIYRWQPQHEIFDEIITWWKSNAVQGICSVMFSYSLGKAQHLARQIDTRIEPVYLHRSIYEMHAALSLAGYDLPEAKLLDQANSDDLRRALVLMPPTSGGSPQLARCFPYAIGVASGWMGVKSNRNPGAIDRGFALSDHADWDGLNRAVEATGANRIIVNHGYAEVFSAWLNQLGYSSTEGKWEMNRVDE